MTLTKRDILNLFQDDEDALESAKKVEQTQMGEIDTDMRDVDALKTTKSFLKSQCDKLEEEANTIKRFVATSDLCHQFLLRQTLVLPVTFEVHQY